MNIEDMALRSSKRVEWATQATRAEKEARQDEERGNEGEREGNRERKREGNDEQKEREENNDKKKAEARKQEPSYSPRE